MIEDNPDYAPEKVECPHCHNDRYFLFRGNFKDGEHDELNCTKCGGRTFFKSNPSVHE